VCLRILNLEDDWTHRFSTALAFGRNGGANGDFAARALLWSNTASTVAE
jgi:hypothetical protein